MVGLGADRTYSASWHSLSSWSEASSFSWAGSNLLICLIAPRGLAANLFSFASGLVSGPSSICAAESRSADSLSQ